MNLFYTAFIYLLILLLLPFMAVIFLAIMVTGGYPVIFRQKRVGKNGKTFTMYKFRTMRHGAQKEQKELTPLNEANGPVFKIHDDPRFTRVGKFLAHTGLDELPQLVNILKGDMSLIGPRPLPVAEAAKLTVWQRGRHTIKPGIISPWILEGYHKQTFDAWMKSDIAYIQRKALLYDCLLTLRTIGFIARIFLHECFAPLYVSR